MTFTIEPTSLSALLVGFSTIWTKYFDNAILLLFEMYNDPMFNIQCLNDEFFF